MNKKKIDKTVVIKAASKMVAEKEMVRSYLKGKVSIEELKENGIKFAKPL